jgi:hypothetical protein
MNLNKSLEIILEKAIGTGSGAIIDMVAELINVIRYLDEEIKKNVHIQVPDVPEELQHVPTGEEMSKPVVPKPEDSATKRAKKGTTGKAKKTTKRSI